MFKQIVVGVDGREGGRDAVALAKLLVAAGGELSLPMSFRAMPTPTAVRPCPTKLPSRTCRGVAEAAREDGCQSATALARIFLVGRGLHELCELIGADLVASVHPAGDYLGGCSSGMTRARR